MSDWTHVVRTYTVDVYNLTDDRVKSIQQMNLTSWATYKETKEKRWFSSTITHCAWSQLNRSDTEYLLDKLERVDAEVVVTDSYGNRSRSIKDHVREFRREFPKSSNTYDVYVSDTGAMSGDGWVEMDLTKAQVNDRLRHIPPEDVDRVRVVRGHATIPLTKTKQGLSVRDESIS